MNSVLKPTEAMIFHQVDHSLAAVTVHKVDNDGGTPVIGPGALLRHVDELRLLSLLSGRSTATHWLDGTVLSVGADRCVWYQPGIVRPMHFRTNAFTGILSVRWPNLIFSAHGHNLRVACYLGRSRPRQSTPLYHAPLDNIDRTGEVCVGSARVPPVSDPSTCEDWESVVFNTSFSHTNYALSLPPSAKDANTTALWWASKDGTDRPVARRDLKPMALSLKNWIANES